MKILLIMIVVLTLQSNTVIIPILRNIDSGQPNTYELQVFSEDIYTPRWFNNLYLLFFLACTSESLNYFSEFGR